MYYKYKLYKDKYIKYICIIYIILYSNIFYIGILINLYNFRDYSITL